MTKRTSYLCAAAAFGIAAISGSSAQAKYVVTFQPLGSDVLETGSGTIDLTDLTGPGPAVTGPAFIHPSVAIFESGGPGAKIQAFDGATGPDSWGPGSTILATSSNGDGIGLSTGGELFVPEGYVSGSALSETSTYGATLAMMGLTPGEYVYRWGSGDHFDTFTLNVGVVPPPLLVPEPSTWAMMLVGFASLGYAAVRRKGVFHGASA